jgi:hypothetical protein
MLWHHSKRPSKEKGGKRWAETGYMNNREISSKIGGAEDICTRTLRLIPIGTIDLQIESGEVGEGGTDREPPWRSSNSGGDLVFNFRRNCRFKDKRPSKLFTLRHIRSLLNEFFEFIIRNLIDESEEGRTDP